MKTKSLCNVLGNGTAILAVLAMSSGLALAQQQQPGYTYPPQQGYGPQTPAYQQPQQPYASQYPQGGQPGYGYQQPPSYAPPPDSRTEYVSPLEFLPTFGHRFGQMFRRIFYGDDAPQGTPGYQGNQPDYNLDTPPPYGSYYGQQRPSTGINVPPRYEAPSNSAPRYETPPQETAPPPRTYQAPPPRPYQTPTGPSTSEKRKAPVASSTPKKYTPPSVTRNPISEPKVESQPPSPKTSVPTKEKEKEKTVSTPPSTDYNFYPLPGSKPKEEKDSPPTTSAAHNSNGSAGAGKSAGAANSGSFLKGKRTNKEGRVISPYPPYQELDVTGLSSGSLALDPTTQKVFEVP